MSEHTKGPWVAVDRGTGWEVHVAGDRRCWSDDHARCGGSVTDFGSGRHETMREADARLVAAAPDLLESLEGLRDALASIAPEAWGVELDRADAAIAKARGIQQPPTPDSVPSASVAPSSSTEGR